MQTTDALPPDPQNPFFPPLGASGGPWHAPARPANNTFGPSYVHERTQMTDALPPTQHLLPGNSLGPSNFASPPLTQYTYPVAYGPSIPQSSHLPQTRPLQAPTIPHNSTFGGPEFSNRLPPTARDSFPMEGGWLDTPREPFLQTFATSSSFAGRTAPVESPAAHNQAQSQARNVRPPCENCRRRHVKCYVNSPNLLCNNCISSDTHCTLRPPPSSAPLQAPAPIQPSDALTAPVGSSTAHNQAQSQIMEAITPCETCRRRDTKCVAVSPYLRCNECISRGTRCFVPWPPTFFSLGSLAPRPPSDASTAPVESSAARTAVRSPCTRCMENGFICRAIRPDLSCLNCNRHPNLACETPLGVLRPKPTERENRDRRIELKIARNVAKERDSQSLTTDCQRCVDEGLTCTASMPHTSCTNCEGLQPPIECMFASEGVVRPPWILDGDKRRE
jgi:hypothetical protein